jgi:membrane-bound metal-dependent hydrolase YbcI (DUF457 family)
MMGRTHAASGILAFGGAALAHVAGHNTWWDLALGTLTAMGAAMLPDLDHPKATMTKSMGPLSWLVCHAVILPIFGGHRKGTHSIAFVAIVGLAAQTALIYRDHVAGAAVMWLLLSLSWASGVRLLKIRGWLDDVIPVVLAAGLVFVTDWDLSVVPIALMIGAAAHVAGDCLTDKGCPLLWPMSRAKFGINLFTTGKAGETLAMIVILAGIVAEVVYAIARWLEGS